jgi:hypothetical protein
MIKGNLMILPFLALALLTPTNLAAEPCDTGIGVEISEEATGGQDFCAGIRQVMDDVQNQFREIKLARVTDRGSWSVRVQLPGMRSCYVISGLRDDPDFLRYYCRVAGTFQTASEVAQAYMSLMDAIVECLRYEGRVRFGDWDGGGEAYLRPRVGLLVGARYNETRRTVSLMIMSEDYYVR